MNCGFCCFILVVCVFVVGLFYYLGGSYVSLVVWVEFGFATCLRVGIVCAECVIVMWCLGLVLVLLMGLTCLLWVYCGCMATAELRFRCFGLRVGVRF